MNAPTESNERGYTRVCETCLYYYYDEETQLKKCMRFSRYVDHVITEATKDCTYWTHVDDNR